jgi:hypothetical protein
VARYRTVGMTALAVANSFIGGIGILNGIFLALGCAVTMYELFRFGIFEIPVVRVAFAILVLATGIVGLVAGIGILKSRPWARTLNLVYAGLLLLSCVGSYVIEPIIATIGTYDIGSIDASGLTRLIIFGTIDVAIPVPYALVLCVAFRKSARATHFAEDPTTGRSTS